MTIGMEVGLGPGHIVLDRDPAPPNGKGHSSPHCHNLRARPYNPQPMSIVAKRLDDQDDTWYGGRPQPRPHCVTWEPSFPPPKKRGTAAPTFLPMSTPCLKKRPTFGLL